MFAVLIFIDMAIFYWMSLAYVMVPLESDTEELTRSRTAGNFTESERRSSLKTDSNGKNGKSVSFTKTLDDTELEPLMSRDETRYDETQKSDSNPRSSKEDTSDAVHSDKKFSRSRKESNIFSIQ